MLGYTSQLDPGDLGQFSEDPSDLFRVDESWVDDLELSSDDPSQQEIDILLARVAHEYSF